MFLGHNFSTWNPSELSEVSKNLNFSLVSNKNFSEILPSSRLGLGPEEMGQKAYNYSTYDATHKKSKTLKLLLLFFFIQTQRLAESCKVLNTSLALTVPKIFPHKDTCKLLVLGWKHTGSQGVKIKSEINTYM